MPQEIPRIGPTQRVRFVRNKVYAGTYYGPDYPQQVADVDVAWVRVFMAQGAVVPVGDAAEVASTPSEPAVAAPEPEVEHEPAPKASRRKR